MRAIVLLVVLVACGSSNTSRECEWFAELESTCQADGPDGPGFVKLVHDLAYEACTGRGGSVPGDLKQKTGCARKSIDCAAYRTCVDADGVKYLAALKRRLEAVARTVDVTPASGATGCRVPGTPQVMQREELLGRPGAIELAHESACTLLLQFGVRPDALISNTSFLACDRASHVVVISTDAEATRLRFHVVATDTAKIVCAFESEPGFVPLRSARHHEPTDPAAVELERHVVGILRDRLGVTLAP